MKTTHTLLKTFLMLGTLIFSNTPFILSKPLELQELSSGVYQATIQAIVCDGCGEFIQKTLTLQPEIDSVVVNQKTKSVTFQVKKGKKIRVAELQNVLKRSSEKMGMGADYTLLNLKKVS